MLGSNRPLIAAASRSASNGAEKTDVPRPYRLASNVAARASRTNDPDLHRSDPERRDHHLGDLPPGVLLLASDQPAVANGERLEQAALHVVGTPRLQHVLDAPWHHLLTDERVAEVL